MEGEGSDGAGGGVGDDDGRLVGEGMERGVEMRVVVVEVGDVVGGVRVWGGGWGWGVGVWGGV